MNGLNILTNGDGEISGIIDWEGSSWKPFGFSFYGLQTFLTTAGNDKMMDMELKRTFTETLWGALPPALVANRKEFQRCIAGSHAIGILYRVLYYTEDAESVSEYDIEMLDCLFGGIDSLHIVSLKRVFEGEEDCCPGGDPERGGDYRA
jgi:hypothetical protein